MKDGLYDAFQKGKQRKLLFKIKTRQSTDKVLQLLHMELFGLVYIIPIFRISYSLVIVDDYSRYWTYFLISKDDASQYIINHIKKMNTGTN